MSLVDDQVRRIDGQLDRFQFSDTSEDHSKPSRLTDLQSLIKSLSTTTSRAPIQSRQRLTSVLQEANLSRNCTTCRILDGDKTLAQEVGGILESDYEHELEWLLVGKATVQTYGVLLDAVLHATVPLGEHLQYWDEVLGSYRWSAIYSAQTSPLRLWAWCGNVFQDVKNKTGGALLSEGWSRLYGLVEEVVKERSMSEIQKRVVSPLSRSRNDVRQKHTALKAMMHLNANALGILLGEGLSNESSHDDVLALSIGASSMQEHRSRWKKAISHNIALMEAVLRHISDSEMTVGNFDREIYAAIDRDYFTELAAGTEDQVFPLPGEGSERLQDILVNHMREYTLRTKQMERLYGRPPRLVRYWLPMSVALVSSSTILRVLFNRKAEILIWIRDFGATVIDFWSNWVVEPTKKVIGTIRHDEGSEVSIMSKRSLEGDRASLERMVVDFAVDSPDGPRLDEGQIADLRFKIKEGDLTPVLKAYEKDLQKPFIGAVRGNLVRALLIQIQKTKVDVEVAMGGIDSLLKSQELVFGFVGLTPGVLVCLGVFRWLNGMFGSRKGLQQGEKQGQMLRSLRNIDRILTSSTPMPDCDELYYKDHGLLLCEVQALRHRASLVLPKNVFGEFVDDLADLVDVRTGVKRQRRVVKRLRWAYSKWL